MKRSYLSVFLIIAVLIAAGCNTQRDEVPGGAILSDLIKPIDGRSMRATSTKTDENGKPITHNADNSRVKPGETKVVLEAKGPGVVTHMWFTFLGPARHPWATNGSATHQEMLIRVY